MALVTFTNNQAPYLSAENLNNNFEYLENLNNYSTDEIVVGKWIDGKPIYRKVVTGNSISSDINTNITDFEDIVKMSVYVRQNDSVSWRTIPWLFVQNNQIGYNSWAGGYYFENGILKFQIGDNLKNINKFIAIFEYTKTTD